ncbi:hypothetical protein DCAR_0521816 [Daucus carota subsp. sativus]|uniref:Pentacotripeptide-repeat region of PRORP domain-containing protein n=2 Tax=Daucus carota subsp. sativus TaxID=79200 RepID=A0A164ZET3_DAUCS|nr:hypothetical protein DCAR_0521816 [Daucus carota subsp. sativus]
MQYSLHQLKCSRPLLARFLHQHSSPDDKIYSILASDGLSKAVSALFSSPSPFSFNLYEHLFSLCSSNRSIVEARKVESHLTTFATTPPAFLINRAIQCYGKCGCLSDARELFDEMPHKNGGSWNAMITAYAKNGCVDEGVSVFLEMNGVGVLPNEITFASVLGCCGVGLELGLSKQIHGLIFKLGFAGNVILGCGLVDIYGKCSVMGDARKVFDETGNPNVVSWNVIVRRYLENGEGKEAVFMFSEMIRNNLVPLNYTVSNALGACSSISGLNEGSQIHGYSLKINFKEDCVVLTSLINMYVKCGALRDARVIFDRLGTRDLGHWTSMVSGYAKHGKIREARELFDQMPVKNLISWNAMLDGYTHLPQLEEALDFVFLMLKEIRDIDYVTVGLILHICAGLSDIELGKQVHGYSYRHGLCSNGFVVNALLYMYGNCGNLRSCRVLFYYMGHLRDYNSWNAVLTTLARHKMSEEALMIFSKMINDSEAKPSNYNCGTVLSVCANISALNAGKEIHGFMVRNGYIFDVVATGALVDMYSKCCRVEYALKVFHRAACRDLILWNCILLGCSHNCRVDEVFELLEMMDEDGIKPDHVTFQAVFAACINGSRVELGRRYFDAMSNKFFITPHLEDYESMIELYGRNGFMADLENFVKNMPFDPTVPMLSKVLNFCREHEHLSFGKWAANRLNDMNSSDAYRFEPVVAVG